MYPHTVILCAHTRTPRKMRLFPSIEIITDAQLTISRLKKYFLEMLVYWAILGSVGQFFYIKSP